MTVAPALTEADLEPYRRELTGYCYRMLGSAADAQDAVQDTMLRAWKGGFEGRSSVRTYLYKIATNTCIDARRARRATPMDMGPSRAPVVEALGEALPEESWVTPAPTWLVADPADVVADRESVRLAFVAALQHLPPKQRAVLILVEVLRWSAAEIADLLDTTVASVNSALQRGRATMSSRPSPVPDPLPADLAGLLARYVAAFERYDIDALTRLLREDATMNMPPYSLWLSGPADIAAWQIGPGGGCAGSVLAPVDVNGTTGFAQWKPDGSGGYAAWALVALETDGTAITQQTFFLDVATIFPVFDLPLTLTAEEAAARPTL